MNSTNICNKYIKPSSYSKINDRDPFLFVGKKRPWLFIFANHYRTSPFPKINDAEVVRFRWTPRKGTIALQEVSNRKGAVVEFPGFGGQG